MIALKAKEEKRKKHQCRKIEEKCITSKERTKDF